MKKFFIVAIIFVVLLFVADRGIGLFFHHLDQSLVSYPIDYQTVYTHLAWEIDDDVVIIGNSRARHQYDANRIQDSLNMTVVNAGKDGNQLLLQSSMIQNMLKRHTPKLIIWEADPYGLMHSDDEIQRISDLNPFYDEDSLCRSLIQSRGWNERYKMLLYCYRNNGRLPGLLEVKFWGKQDNGLNGYVPVKSSGYKYPTLHIQNFSNSSEQYREKLFAETIRKAKQQGCNVVIATTPQYKRTNLDKTIQYKRFAQICDLEGILWLNYNQDARFLCDSTYFKDVSHLNEKGVDKYMELFIPKLKEYIDETNVR